MSVLAFVALRVRARQHPSDLASCVTLERWSWTETATAADVTARVRVGMDGSFAVDAVAKRDSDDVFVPKVLTHRLERTVARAGETLVLTEHLRRVRPGEPNATTLRFSCRPVGAEGTFGVIQYVGGKTTPSEEDVPSTLSRSLPPPTEP